MSELTQGALLAGRYFLVRRIGGGGMGDIWLADDRRSESRVALKFQKGSSSAAERELLREEWRIGSRLMHANIVRVFEFHDEPDAAYYAMQYIGGPDLSILTDTAVDDILRPIGLIADSLRYAHAKDIVHRDIKASNILLDARGIPYLVDFGIAAIVGQATAGGGTPIAASPQQLAGDPAQPADDIYALGVLMSELVTGRPLSATDDVGLLVDCNGEPLPRAVASLITDMLNKNSAERPTAETVKDRLEKAGFPAGTAPTRLLSAHVVESEAHTSELIQPAERKKVGKAAVAPGADTDSGISPKMLYGSLAALLAIFLAVIFLLPLLVNEPSQQDAATTPLEEDISSETGPAFDLGESGDKDVIEEEPDLSIESGESADNAGARAGIVDGDAQAIAKIATDEALGELLSRIQALRFRAIERWGGQPYQDMLTVYADGDEAYVNKNYTLAGERYRLAIELIDPFFEQADIEFDNAFALATDAFDNGDHINAIKFFDLASAINPGDRAAAIGFVRAKNLKNVLALMDQALKFEVDLELDAARIAFEQVLDLDPVWGPAIRGLERIKAAIKQFSFEQRMTEGFESLAAGDFATARAAFNAAKALHPNSSQPADGLLQVDQEIRLLSIARFERQAAALEKNEEWEAAIAAYEKVLEIDADLQFALNGIALAQQRAKLHATLAAYIDDPDSLSAPVSMRRATKMLLDLTRISPMGPRLEDQKNVLSRLLKRAATALDVMLISNSQTNVTLFRIARLGTFEFRKLSLRPGVYVAVGSRSGYRDVRIEFRVAPEIEMKPIVVQCEEQI